MYSFIWLTIEKPFKNSFWEGQKSSWGLQEETGHVYIAITAVIELILCWV